MLIGEVRLSANGRELHFPPHVEEQLLEDDPEDIKTECFFVGDDLRMVIPNTPYDLVVDVPLREWTMRGTTYKRSFRDRCVYVKKWKDTLDIEEDDEGKYVQATIRLATMDDVEYSAILKTTDRGLTLHEARQLVDDYYDDFSQTRSHVKAPDILRYADEERSPHNVSRIRNVLEERFDSVGFQNHIKTFSFTEGEV